METFKKINNSDISISQYNANKSWSFTYSASINDDYLKYYIGTNGVFSLTGSIINNKYETSVYDLVNQLYYQEYTNSLNTQSLFNSNNYISSSEQRATASYYKYDNYNLIKNFPSSSNDKIGVLSISSNIFGNNILPYTFQISSSLKTLADDGNGNLYDISFLPSLYVSNSYVNPFYAVDSAYISGSYISASIYIGNIFYSQGMCVITNSSYVNFLNPPTGSTVISFKNNFIIHENEVKCIVRSNEFNSSYNTSLQKNLSEITSSNYKFYLTNGDLKDFATSSYFSPYVTTVGLYNDNNELLAVAKLSKPLVKSLNTDMTFIISFDI